MQGDSMKDKDVDKYLKEHLPGSAPREEFREQTLRDSTAAFVRIQRQRLAWQRLVFSAAAVLIAGIAFLGGRLSVPRQLPGDVEEVRRVAAGADGVNVPSDVVIWLDAARLFKRLGLEERMARAFDNAGKLLPYEAIEQINMTGKALAMSTDGEEVLENQNRDSILAEILSPLESVDNISGILAQSFGEYYYENEKY